VPAGYLVDRWNVRWTYAGAVAWWSAAGMASAFSPSLAVLMVLRAVLGVGESFNWPCALRVTATILPPADRSLGNGIFNSGAAVGAVLTPLVVTLLTARFEWRTAFLAIGILGFLWVVVWLVLVGGPIANASRAGSWPL
jgi:MFS transporter, ACS family, aldohexuronate transporter